MLGDLVRHVDSDTLEEVYALLKPGDVVYAPLDLGVVFPEERMRGDELWSMLYLAGFLTTDVTVLPNDTMTARPLRIPNYEVARLYCSEVVERFLSAADGRFRLAKLHRGILKADEGCVTSERRD